MVEVFSIRKKEKRNVYNRVCSNDDIFKISKCNILRIEL